MLESMLTLSFWTGVFQIFAIDIVLGGDNAVVIALACRGLPEDKRKKGIFWGVFGAVALRIVLIFFALTLLKVPYLKLAAALLLMWIGIQLLQPENEDEASGIAASTTLLAAIRTIIMADAVMSIDNVVGVAGAAHDQMTLIIFGISLSIPVIVFGSKLILQLMDRYPAVILVGAALIGWVAGDMLMEDAAVKVWVEANFPLLAWISPAFAAVGTVLIGKMRARAAEKKPIIDLGEG